MVGEMVPRVKLSSTGEWQCLEIELNYRSDRSTPQLRRFGWHILNSLSRSLHDLMSHFWITKFRDSSGNSHHSSVEFCQFPIRRKPFRC